MNLFLKVSLHSDESKKEGTHSAMLHSILFNNVFNVARLFQCQEPADGYHDTNTMQAWLKRPFT